MSPKINILTDETIGKIAAGEVVERPASVVKELIENSIDAGSDSIMVEVQGGGQGLVRVADNGEGMSPEDAELACRRHSTSKIAAAEDLGHITSLGFRGEALASIAAVSRVEIITRSGGADIGVSLFFESAQAQRIRPASRSKGTTVEVRDLFYNVPARRKFLKKESTEMAEIANVVGRFVLSHTGIGFKLTHGRRVVLDVPGNSDLAYRVRYVFGDDVYKGMMAVSGSEGGMNVKGFASRPGVTRKDRKYQMFFLNGRSIRSRVLADCLQKAYKGTLERGTYPSSVLFLDMPPEKVDVNVHPAKLQAKFDDEASLREMVEAALKEAFGALKKEDGFDTIVPPEDMRRKEAYRAESPVTLTSPEVQSEFGYICEDVSKAACPESPPVLWFSGGRDETCRRNEFSCAGNCYIVQAGEDGLVLTDQHAAHERVLYEFFRKACENSGIEVQDLLFPVRVDLSAPEALMLEKLKDDLAKLGFRIEPFGDRSFVVQALPAILRDRDVSAVIMEVLRDLSGEGMKKADMLDELIKIISCRAAVKAGARLADAEIRSLLEKLKNCEVPFTCPHGRPTTISIPVGELEKMFRRK